MADIHHLFVDAQELPLRATDKVRTYYLVSAIKLNNPITRVERRQLSAISKLGGAVCSVSVPEPCTARPSPGWLPKYHGCLLGGHARADPLVVLPQEVVMSLAGITGNRDRYDNDGYQKNFHAAKLPNIWSAF